MTNIGRRTLLTCFLCLLVVALAAVAVVPCFAANKVVASADEGSYYSGLNTSLTGDDFRTELAKLLKDTHKHITSYRELLNVYKKADYDPSNKNNILLFYTGESRPIPANFNSGVNREHVWAQSLGNFGTSNAGADGHHLMACDSKLNSTRGNKGFKEVPQTAANKVSDTDNCYTSGNWFYPQEGYRGAVARILMYVQVRWGGDNSTLKFTDSATGKGDNAIGSISTLMKWHLEETPSEWEIRRNEEVAKIQGNRNPFIDHPEYAAQIYGYAGSYFTSTTVANSVAEVIKNHNVTPTPDPKPDQPTVKTVSYVSVDGTANKLGYIAGEEFNHQGLTVKVTYSDGSVAEIAGSSCKWLDANTGMETLSAGTTAVVCRYENCDSAKIGGITVTSQVTGEHSITITRKQSADGGSYGWMEWSVGGISGQSYTYPGNKDRFQFNSNKPYFYLFNSTALTGGIKSVKVVGTDSKWQLRVNNTAYKADVTGSPTEGVSVGEKNVLDGATWQVDGNYEYFTLNYVGTGAAYLTEIVVTYGATNDGTTDTISLDNLSATLEVGKTTKIGVKASGSVSYVTSDSNVCTVDGEGNVAAVGKGVATITVTCGNARAEMLIVVGESTTPDPDPTPNPNPDPDPTPNPNPNPDPFKDSDSSAGCKGVVSTVGTITALLIAVAGAAIVRKRHE